jgi:hypothetical protein
VITRGILRPSRPGFWHHGRMAIARFKDLCIDASDVDAVGSFWRTTLEATAGPDREDGVLRLDVPGPKPWLLWVNPVPEEPPPVKTRVHVDFRLPVDTPDALVAGGARVLRLPGEDSWWVLADPEGNEFCAFPTKPGAEQGVFELVVDSADPVAQADWWASVTGGTAKQESDYAYIEDADGLPWDYWVFGRVPEPKTVKNRVHWDVTMSDAEPSALVEAGATVLRPPDDDIGWWIMSDPEGNEFCGFPPDR